MTEFKRETTVTPAYDKRHTDPKKNYGIHSCEIRFFLTGPKGVIQFVVYTGWELPHVKEEIGQRLHDMFPMGADVGCHSLVPMYENQTQMDCHLLEGGKCYYDGSSLRAQEWMTKLIEGGTEWLWPAMEEEYRYQFERDTNGEDSSQD